MTVTTRTASYVYGIVPARGRRPSGTGIASARLRTVPDEEIAALVSEVPAGELQAGRDELMTHARVLESALKRGAVLPMRFGVVMPDADAVREELLERFHDELAMQLQALTGKGEVRLRAIYEEQALMAEVVDAQPEIARRTHALRQRPADATYYERIELGHLVAEAVERARASDTAAILEALEPLAVASDVDTVEHERVAANVSFLVEDARLASFDRAVDRLGRSNAGRLRFKYSGPMPAYSFVELPEQE